MILQNALGSNPRIATDQVGGAAAKNGRLDMDALPSVLTRLQRQGAALGHFNVADLVLLKAVVAAAVEVRVPVIVGASEGERDFLGTYELAALVKVMRAEHDVSIFLNADHTHSLAKAVEAAKAGFDAVVIDFSALPFDQNVSRTKETVEAIKAINPAILAEGEIGDIGTGSEIHETAHNEFRNLILGEQTTPTLRSPSRHVKGERI